MIVAEWASTRAGAGGCSRRRGGGFKGVRGLSGCRGGGKGDAPPWGGREKGKKTRGAGPRAPLPSTNGTRGMRPQPLGPGYLGSRLVGHALGPELEEPGIGVMDERDVEAVNPRHRLVGLVVVTVEMPTGGEQEVTAAHRDRIPVDHRPHPLALD